MVDNPSPPNRAGPLPLRPREAVVLAAVRGRAPPGDCRVVASVADLASEVGLQPGEVSRALTRLWLDGRIRLEQAPSASELSRIDLLDAPTDEERGKGGEEPEQNKTNRSELIDIKTEQIGTNCSEGVGHPVLGEAAAAPRERSDEARRERAAPTGEDASVFLARLCADRLGAYDSLPAFVTLARRYGAPRLRQALDEVLALPDARIKKSRAALFTFLVKHGV